jgi:hypothetical protein
MPKVPPDPGELHVAGGEDDGSVKLDAVQRGESASGQEVLVCEATNLAACDGGRVKLKCTLKGHHKIHYDAIFSKEWV